MPKKPSARAAATITIPAAPIWDQALPVYLTEECWRDYLQHIALSNLTEGQNLSGQLLGTVTPDRITVHIIVTDNDTAKERKDKLARAKKDGLFFLGQLRRMPEDLDTTIAPTREDQPQVREEIVGPPPPGHLFILQRRLGGSTVMIAHSKANGRDDILRHAIRYDEKDTTPGSGYSAIDQHVAKGFAALTDPQRRANPLWKLTVRLDLQGIAIADRTNRAFLQVALRYPTWLKAKVTTLTDASTKPRNVVAILGEIRALAHLSSIWPGTKPRKSGADFEVALNGETILIEVTTPQGATKNTTQQLGTSKRREGNIAIDTTVTSVMPLGRPERTTIDNVQGEATSWIAQLKEPEHQLSDEQPSILWIDFQDEDLSFVARTDIAVPIGQFREELTSGPLWMALYGEKGDPVYANYPANPLPAHEPVYHMEFNGRFAKKSKLDFVIADFGKTQVALANPNTQKPGAAQLPQYFHRLPGFAPELSWLDWPATNTLARRIEDTRRTLLAYEGAFPAPK